MVLFRQKPEVSPELPKNRNHVSSSPASKPKSILKAADSKNAILWCSISRDQVSVARVLTNPPHPDAPRLSQEVLRTPASTGWDYFTFGQEEYKPGFRGCKFHVHQRNPFPNGSLITIRGYSDASLNGKPVSVQSYSPSSDMYLVYLSNGQTLSISSEYVVGQAGRDNIVWTYVCIYNNRLISQAAVCSFLEKLAMISEGFLQEWVHGKRLCGQEVFGEIIGSQVELYDALGKDAFHDDSLDFAKSVIAKNQDLLSEGSF